MKQRILIFGVLIFLIALLAGLNAATYVQKEKEPDREFDANRSTYNSGSTGTQAFYSLLSETGRRVTRWQSPLDTIASDVSGRPDVFVMIGPLRRELTEAEYTQLKVWVGYGGTLVLVDRQPPSELAMTTAPWRMTVHPNESPDLYSVDSTDQKQMTTDVPAVKPALPSTFAHTVNAVQASRFASTISLERVLNGDDADGSGESITTRPVPQEVPYEISPDSPPPQVKPPPPATGRVRVDPNPSPYELSEEAATPRPDEDYGAETDDEETVSFDENAAPAFEAPVVHLGGGDNNLLVEAPYGKGRVIILSDPYIVSNGGINLADNSRLAVNLVTSRNGLIAFDEYHHGYGANNNRFLQYFEGTPVIAIFIQLGILIALVFFSQSRRFARPVPEPEPSRLSKLEYVSAMAELQQRTRAYDLAVENIYTDFRRRASALVGLDNTVARAPEIAARLAERTGRDPVEITELMLECEDVIHGEPIRRKDTVALIERIRAIEEELGLKRADRKRF